MTRLAVELRGVERLAARLRRMESAMQDAASGAVAESGAMVAEEARRALGRGDRASRPGEKPRSVSGRLAASLASTVDSTGRAAAVGTRLAYGRFLEFGTTRMAARPWLLPTFERLKARIGERMRRAARSALARSVGR